MSDYADSYTDKKISQVDRELRKTYRNAQKELKQKLADFNKKFAEKSKEMKKRLATGEITKEDYQSWLTGKVFVRNQWQEKIKVVNAVMLDHNKQAMNLINNGTLDVFAESYNYSAWKAESEIAASFTVYNAESVARLILGDPQLLPKWKINEKKDYNWNYTKVNNIIRQAIIQGKGVEEITGELCDRLSSTNDSKMRMFARTALGSAQNAGRQAQMDDAVKMGIEVNKRWDATHDGKTRDSHRAMDGEEVPENQPFSNGLMFPKDPQGAPEEIYNCRCRMVAIYPKYEDRSQPSYTEGMTIDGQSYREWKKFDNYEEWKKWKEETGQVKGKRADAIRISQTSEKDQWKELITVQELADRYNIKGDVLDKKVMTSVADAYIKNSNILLPESSWTGIVNIIDSKNADTGYYDFDKGIVGIDKDADFATAIHELIHSRSRGATNKEYKKNARLEEACVETITQSLISKIPVNQSIAYPEWVSALGQLSKLTESSPDQFAAILIDIDMTKRYDYIKQTIETYCKENDVEDWEKSLYIDRFVTLGGKWKNGR